MEDRNRVTSTRSFDFAVALNQLREAHENDLQALQTEVICLRAEVGRLQGLNFDQTLRGPDTQEHVTKQMDISQRSLQSLVVGRPSVSLDLAKSVGIATESGGTGSRQKHKGHQELRILSVREEKKIQKTPTDKIGPIENFVLSFMFEVFFAILITLHALVMAIESQYIGDGIFHQLFETQSAENATWPGAEMTFRILSWIFGILFSLEVLLKMAGLRERFLRDAWNWLDTIIVLFWIIETSLECKFSENFRSLGVNPGMLRIMRLARLVRLVRLVRTIQGFDALYVMTTALTGSLSVLAWSCIVLLVFQSLLALLLQKLLADLYFTDVTQPLEKRQEVFIYFGTFTRAVFSMYEITLANWPPVARVLAENVTEWFMLFAVAHKLTIGFALVGIVNGVLMQETFKVASTDDRIMVRQKEKATNMHAKKMHMLFKSADSSGNGLLDLQEFREVLTEPGVKTWLAAMELDAGEDADNLFSLLEKEGGQVSADALIRGMARLKGSARSIDMISLMQEVKRLQGLVMGSSRPLAGSDQAGDNDGDDGLATDDLGSPQWQSPVQGVPSRSFSCSDSSNQSPVQGVPSRSFSCSDSSNPFDFSV